MREKFSIDERIFPRKCLKGEHHPEEVNTVNKQNMSRIETFQITWYEEGNVRMSL